MNFAKLKEKQIEMIEKVADITKDQSFIYSIDHNVTNEIMQIFEVKKLEKTKLIALRNSVVKYIFDNRTKNNEEKDNKNWEGALTVLTSIIDNEIHWIS